MLLHSFNSYVIECYKSRLGVDRRAIILNGFKVSLIGATPLVKGSFLYAKS